MRDFEFTGEQRAIKRAAFEFAKGEFDKDLPLFYEGTREIQKNTMSGYLTCKNR